MRLLNRLLYRLASPLPLRVIKEDDRPYLERYYVGTLLGVRCYLHRFVGSDPDRGLHDQRHAGSLGGLQVGEERQSVLHGRHRLGGQAPGVLLEPAQQRLGHRVQQDQRRAPRRQRIVVHA